MLRQLPLFALIALLAAPLAAQAPAGLKVRIDRSTDAADPDNVPDIKIAAMGNGFHVVGGPAGTFWDAKNTATGSYTAKATFNLMEPSSHPNYYGIVFGGSDLESDSQSYHYFIVAQNGQFQVRTRKGAVASSVHPTGRGGVAHPAIRTPGTDGRSTNVLEVRVAGDNVSYVVNDTVVHTMPKGGLTTDGLVGVRINHLLNVHVDSFELRK
jgi:hypothetical protein